jgi:hypothetical protein
VMPASWLWDVAHDAVVGLQGNNVRIVLRGQLKRLQNQFVLSIGHQTGNLR